MKIGIDIRECKKPSGVGKYVRDLVVGLQQYDELQLYLFYDGAKEDLSFPVNQNTICISRCAKHAWYWEQIWLPKMLTRLRVDVYHATNNVGLPILYRGRKVSTIHDVIPLIHPEVLPRKIQRYRVRTTLRIDARITDKIITDSEASRQDILSRMNIDPQKAVVVWPIRFPTTGQSDQAISNKVARLGELHIPNGYIIHNGGMDPRKNIPRLLRAFRSIIQSSALKDCKLVITGRSSTAYARSMVAYANQLGICGSVTFTGELCEKDIGTLIRGSLFSIYPSIIEGFGLPIIEAMAFGTPVITSNISCMPEVSGGAALLVDPYDETMIADAMKHLALRPDVRSQMVQAGREWINRNRHYDMVAMTYQVYMEAK